MKYKYAPFVSQNVDNITAVKEYLSAHGVVSQQGKVLDHHVFYVQASDYLKALTLGSVFICENFIQDVSWVTPEYELVGNISPLAFRSKLRLSKQRYLQLTDVEDLYHQSKIEQLKNSSIANK